MPLTAPAVPRLTYLRIKNYRALRDVEFRDLTPLTALIGPNGSGKSTVLDALAPEQVWVLHRGADGYTQATRTAELPGIPAMVAEGSPLGYLWSRNFFDVGNPLDLPTSVK